MSFLTLPLAPSGSPQLLWWELWAPDRSLCSPEIPLVEELPLYTTLEHSALDCVGTGATPLGDSQDT